MNLKILLLEKRGRHKTIATDGLWGWYPIWSQAFGLAAKIGQHTLRPLPMGKAHQWLCLFGPIT